jgi:hypothetical protein
MRPGIAPAPLRQRPLRSHRRRVTHPATDADTPLCPACGAPVEPRTAALSARQELVCGACAASGRVSLASPPPPPPPPTLARLAPRSPVTPAEAAVSFAIVAAGAIFGFVFGFTSLASSLFRLLGGHFFEGWHLMMVVPVTTGMGAVCGVAIMALRLSGRD